MRKLTKILFLILLLSAIRYPLNATYATVPHLINYQGRLTDSSGNPLNGSYALTFRIYDAETVGNLLWEEAHSGVVIQKGIFSVLLGSVTALNLPFDKPYFLEIKVGGEVMSPRQRITSAGYAIRAENAEKLNGTEVKTTPTPNCLLALDSSARLPTGQGLLGNNIAVLTGIISDGETIPLPAGYTEEQCQWFVSMAGGYDECENPSQVGNGSWWCYTSNQYRVWGTRGRIVTIGNFYKDGWRNTTGRYPSGHPGNVKANYIVIGMK